MYPTRNEQRVSFFGNEKWEIEEIEVESVSFEEELEDVYDFNVPKHHCFFTDEMLVSNCSEYISLDDTACNLASINVAKFFDSETNKFDIEGYKHSIRIWQMILEITNHMAQLPSESVAYRVWKYRSTGLGPANLGTLLMMMGYPYDHQEGRTISAALMGIMTGQSYAVSAEMAEILGSFPGYDNNRQHMLRVVKNHRAAAYGMSDDMAPKDKQELCKKVPDYVDLTVNPVPLVVEDSYSDLTKLLVDETKSSWDEAVSLGGSFGYRNSQVTVCAPTGTISFVMGCDSTGIEPCYALVTYKTLAGGGVMKIVNNSVKKTLENLDCYDDEQMKNICDFIQENGHVHGSGMKPEHEAIFKCAASPLGDKGIISWEAHISMLAALQSFVSGGISKTINMPESATHIDISEAWKMAYQLGCKGISIYRDNCKLSAPLTANNNSKDQNISEDMIQRVTEESLVAEIVRRKNSNALNIQDLLESIGITQHDVLAARREWGQRKRPGDLLSGMRFRIKIGQAQGYVQIFVYPDGRICEFFLTFGNPGSSLNNMLECWSIAFSIALQRGESLQNLCSKYINVEFEPKGFTGRKDELRRVTSPVDYIARLMLMYFDDEGYIKDPSIFGNIGNIDSAEEDTEEGTTISGFEFSGSKGAKNDSTLSVAQRSPCPKCGAIMTGGSDKCPVCPSCGYFGGCG
jgi:ribonucleoside-diphosphate reductase alpha chain